MAAELVNEEVVKAMKGMAMNNHILMQAHQTQRRWCRSRFTTERWLDENEREWYALDRLCRSRPWATNADKVFAYPFREPSREMQEAEGAWVGADVKHPVWTRGEAPCDVIEQVQVPPEFPAEHRVLLFTPEFGSHTSFDMDSWSFLEPEDKVDIWVCCWQGWTDFGAMVEQVAYKLLSFADGANTVWFGQGMGALVAYEVLKYIETKGLMTPNLPVALVVSDCPAPHLFAESYKPHAAEDWGEKMADTAITEMRKRRILADVGLICAYEFKHDASKKLQTPVVAACHDDEALASTESVNAWEDYSKDGEFELVELGDAEEFEDYLQGVGYASSADPQLLSTIAETCEKYNRWKEDGELPDIGPVEGDIPAEVDCVVVGAGIAGIYQSKELCDAGKAVICMDKYHEIGGVWNFYGNDYSRVNTSEVGYRIVERARAGEWKRPNEDHTPRRDILRDIHYMAHKHCYGKVRINTEVLRVDKLDNGEYDVRTKNVKTGVEHTVHAKAVSFHVNRRIGKKREVDWPESDKFRGQIFYGYGNEVTGAKFWNKRVLVVGAGAFAFENVRTAIEHGAKHVTLLGRRDGTTCPKWIDMIAFLRPLDENLLTSKSGNMISFECWQNCYKDAGLRTPDCWKDGLLKPPNHTISVSDVAFVAGFHGLFKLEVGEIDHFSADGSGVNLTSGDHIDADIVIKCCGFHLNDDVPKVTGITKMQPYGLMHFNLNYGAEPLLDGAQFGSAKDQTGIDTDAGVTPEQYQKGLEVFAKLAPQLRITYDAIRPLGNPFGSGQGGPIEYLSKYFAYLVEHPDEQAALLKSSGEAPQDVVKLWASQIGQYNQIIKARLVGALATLVDKN
mmetsp:Transcript_63354/g.162980  ORF Transcript_63354/g.162980 Transcript_63354/m.162980 type:complete len:848 (-) Transcript_63354:130-2673(-)|eukprot:CAMPEP_0195086894 /NCGR_PEP_ID=MMETSP0448-20130528/26886_1 /TAXON_ID=66468 /ORGANISM="Heterocapsa triquestra, Strain CCMP 448" /LENGTH=847 /DNA_ID=CAMNT_0040120413 /DNA_START=43 /DNA_END=2586 /DNA_ORIENTATION=-